MRSAAALALCLFVAGCDRGGPTPTQPRTTPRPRAHAVRPGATDAPPQDPYAWGWLGVQFRTVKSVPLGAVEVPPGSVVVRSIAEGSPALGSLSTDDILTEMGGRPIEGATWLAAAIRNLPPGEDVEFRVVRADRALGVKVKVGSRRCAEAYEDGVERAIAWLCGQQRSDGAWDSPHPSTIRGNESQPGCAVTALVVAALAGVPSRLAPRAEAAAAKGMAFLKSRINPKGLVDSVASEGPSLSCYATSLTIVAARRRGAPQDDPDVARLVAGLRGLQAAEAWGVNRLDWSYGGWYMMEPTAGGERPRVDISNLACALHALFEAGVPAGDPAFQKALPFLKRTQNVELSRPGVQDLDDGGFAFHPRDSKAGFVEISPVLVKFRSYGSSTCDGMRGLFYALRDRKDPRIQAALSWLQQHYTVDENPGFSPEGAVRYDQAIRFYYLHALAEALHLLGEDTLAPRGGPRLWAVDILASLASLQQAEGCWRNPVDAMGEDDPVVATGLALETLGVLAGHIGPR